MFDLKMVEVYIIHLDIFGKLAKVASNLSVSPEICPGQVPARWSLLILEGRCLVNIDKVDMTQTEQITNNLLGKESGEVRPRCSLMESAVSGF